MAGRSLRLRWRKLLLLCELASPADSLLPLLLVRPRAIINEVAFDPAQPTDVGGRRLTLLLLLRGGGGNSFLHRRDGDGGGGGGEGFLRTSLLDAFRRLDVVLETHQVLAESQFVPDLGTKVTQEMVENHDFVDLIRHLQPRFPVGSSPGNAPLPVQQGLGEDAAVLEVGHGLVASLGELGDLGSNEAG